LLPSTTLGTGRVGLAVFARAGSPCHPKPVPPWKPVQARPGWPCYKVYRTHQRFAGGRNLDRSTLGAKIACYGRTNLRKEKEKKEET